MIVAATIGDPNASIPTTRNLALPAHVRRVWRRRGYRNLRKRDMINNSHLPHIEVDPQTNEVRADGELPICEPASILPLAQRYFLFYFLF